MFPQVDWLSKLRLGSIFNPNEPMPLPMPTMPGSYNPGAEQMPQPRDMMYRPGIDDADPQAFDVQGLMQKLYTPETEATDRFNQMVTGMPQRKTDQGFLRKIGAIAAGTINDLWGNPEAGPGVYEDIMNPGYRRNMAQWKEQYGPAKDAATLERQNNMNERTIAYQTVAQELRAQADAARRENNEAKARIAQQRADAYEFRIKNPNARFVAQKGGNLLAVNPQTGETIRDFGPSGEMTDADLANLNNTNRLGQIAATGAEARTTEGVRHTNDMTEIEARGEQQRQTQNAPRSTGAGGNNGRPPLPTQVKTEQFNKANQLYNTRPDLRPYIKIYGANEFEITPPGSRLGMATGPDATKYKEITDFIYGQQTPPPFQQTNVPPPPPPVSNGARGRGAGPGPNASQQPKSEPLIKQQRNPTTGETRTLISTDGGKTWQIKGK